MDLTTISTTLSLVILSLIIWDTVWKLIGLWHSSKRNQLGWFIAIGVINTAGILPIVYLIWFRKKR